MLIIRRATVDVKQYDPVDLLPSHLTLVSPKVNSEHAPDNSETQHDFEYKNDARKQKL